uniref:Uncharacterized protein n=1 Tax=Cyanothece sp. (strain PCC 7425 / ATCC 29141) TaxID=395961 RepID=B8HLH0_CYAP4
MSLFLSPRSFRHPWLFSTTLATALILPMGVRAQQPSNPAPSGTPPSVEIVSPALPAGGAYTIEGGKRLMADAASAIGAQNYSLAAKKLQDARLIMNQMSNFYQSLSASFLGIDNQASDSSRRKALETAQLRDQATYQLALVYRANNQPELAVPLLVEIIRSQNPTRDLGQKAYQQLLELGFVDIPYPRQGIVAPTTPPPASAQPKPSP